MSQCFFKGGTERFSISNCPLYIRFKIRIKEVIFYLKILFFFKSKILFLASLSTLFSVTMALTGFGHFK